MRNPLFDENTIKKIWKVSRLIFVSIKNSENARQREITRKYRYILLKFLLQGN